MTFNKLNYVRFWLFIVDTKNYTFLLQTEDKESKINQKVQFFKRVNQDLMRWSLSIEISLRTRTMTSLSRARMGSVSAGLKISTISSEFSLTNALTVSPKIGSPLKSLNN